MANTLTKYYSGVSINQNVPPESQSSYVSLDPAVYQQFLLPDSHRVGGEVSPDITGGQFCVNVTSSAATIGVRLEHKPFIGAWTVLAEATATATGVSILNDMMWLTCLFDNPVSVSGLEADNFRFRLQSLDDTLASAWYSVPNPLSSRGASKAFGADGTTPVTDDGREVSLLFRLLTATADRGVDFLGNQYRSVVRHRSASLSSPTSSPDASWMSGPQPSKFAVVAQYFEVQQGSEPVVIDRILLDPTTPGMWFHAYYSNDGTPGQTTQDWEERIWTPVERSYHALRRDTFVLPEPIHARYVKLEYSHLQARSYAVGGFQKPITYQKHPKWVLDYFLLVAEDIRQASEASFVPRNVVVNYDPYQIAFTYYQDDLISDATPPPILTPEDEARVIDYLGSRTDFSDAVDPQTRSQINFTLKPYLQDPRLANIARTLLGEVAALNSSTNPLVEALPEDPQISTLVSSLNRDAVVFEQTFPVMFFYLACRHRYRLVTAPLGQDRAYFAGVREVAFTRERYSVQSDVAVYTETLGDHINAEVNDFLFKVQPPVL